MKMAKKAYLHSLLALVVCISMFVGSTFAWFTDSISSVNNIIKSGNLDLEMYWTDDLTTGTWYNVEEAQYNTIFSYDNWEPGYTDVKYIKIVNKGSLAFKYQLAFTPVGEVGKLAEVINVYYANDGIEVADRSAVTGMNSLGLLASILNGQATANGTLLPADQNNPNAASGEVIVTVAMSMLTTAGNEYQLQSAGDFTVTAMATQVENEFDSFGNDYDTDAEWPQTITASKGEAAITTVGGVTDADVSINAGDVTATVPAGVKVNDGVEKLTLTTTPLKNSTSDITPIDGEILVPLDVHIEGIAEDNTTPIIIDLGAILPTYLNMGAYSLYHVEDGVTETMNLVASVADLANHNDYVYDSATGNVTVALASFSEIAILQPADNTYNVWYGGVDFRWYEENPDAKSFTIYNADQLNALAYIVSGQYHISTTYEVSGQYHDTFEGDTITLARDIDLNGSNPTAAMDLETGKPIVWYPIGMRKHGETGAAGTNSGDRVWYTWGDWFQGTFDGNGHTIRNINQRTWDMDGNYEDGYYKRGMGLFAGLSGVSEEERATVMNLTIENFQSDGEFTPTGCIAAYGDEYVLCKNIRLVNCNPRVYNTGNGGLIGYDNGGDYPEDPSNFRFENITVDATNKISALWGSWDVPCGGILGYLGNSSIAHFENCSVSAIIDVNNDVCANYQYYWYRYAGMYIGTVDRTINSVIDLKGITANNCKADFADRHEYYYCELVENTLASYTHDHQMSRLVNIKDISEIKSGENWTKTGNFMLVENEAGHEGRCYHIRKDENGNFYEHFHENSGKEKVDGVEVLKEDKQRLYLPFRQLFGTYGWGTRGISLTEYNEKNPDATINVEIGDNETKFDLNVDWAQKNLQYNVAANNKYTTLGIVYGSDVTIGNYFVAAKGMSNLINGSGVHVSVTPVAVQKLNGEIVKDGDTLKNVKVNSKFTLKSNWAESTLNITCDNINEYKYVWVAITIQDYANCKPYTIRAVLNEGSLDNDIENPWFK